MLFSRAFATVFAVAATGVAAAPGVQVLRDLQAKAEEIVARQNDAWILQNWRNENAGVDSFTNGPAGEFAVEWNQPNGGNFVIGKGHRPARAMLFNYTGTFELGSNSNSYLGLYGWTRNPLTEYYVIENFGKHHPADNANSTCYGTFESDGGTYEVWMKWRVNAPSIIGTATFPQFWSVRTKRHTGGTINTGKHFDAWTKAGLKLGTQDYMVIGVEAQWGDGKAHITAGVKPATTVRETATPTTRTERPYRTDLCTRKL